MARLLLETASKLGMRKRGVCPGGRWKMQMRGKYAVQLETDGMLKMLLYNWRIIQPGASSTIHVDGNNEIKAQGCSAGSTCTWLARVIPSVVRQYGYSRWNLIAGE